jgi:hypothetical protein
MKDNMTNLKLSKSELIAYTTLWCLEQGIKPRDLGCGSRVSDDGKIIRFQNAHPAIDDVLILIKLRDEFWEYWNHNEKCVWAAHWSSVYHKGHPFKAKALKNIELLANSGIFRQQTRLELREKIRQLRDSN